MSVNLIELVKGQLGDSVLDQIGGMLGESAENTRNAVDASVPTILGSIIDKVSNDSDAGSMLSGALDNLDDGIADDFTSFLQPDKQESLLEKGSGLLSGLLGDNMGSVVDMISKFSGIGSKSSSSLLGMVLPLVLGFIGKERSTGGLDQDGVMNLLSSQKENISQSMPSGMTDLLGQSGIMSGLTGMLSGGVQNIVESAGDVVDSATSAVSDAANSVGDAVSGVTDTASDVVGGAEDIVDSAAGTVSDAASSIGDAVSSVTDTAADVAGDAKDAAADAIGATSDAVGDAVSSVTDTAADIAGGAKDAAADAIGATSDAVGNVGEAVSDAAGNAKDSVVDAVGAAKDSASNVASGAADAAGQAASAGGSMIRKILPIAAIALVVLFLLKQCM